VRALALAAGTLVAQPRAQRPEHRSHAMNSPPDRGRRTVLGSAACALLACAASAAPLHAQSIDDGLMMPKKALFTGVLYGHDQWSEYWEGTLKRENLNVGTLTTKSVTWMGNYGLFDRLNVIVLLPYVSTRASGGTLHPQEGLQDLTVALKGRLFVASLGNSSLRGFAVATYGTPVSDYVADLLPLSIGLHSQQLSGRLTTHLRTAPGFFADATGAYTFRGNVTLDRPSYFTNGELFLTDQVDMPNVFDYTVRAGFMRRGFMFPVSFSQQYTLGGGDIRRQDMPFVSNKMNYSKLDAMAMYTLKKPWGLAFQARVSRVLSGRNVGESTTFGAGILYTLRFTKQPVGRSGDQ
jgi:hypothetical protein